MLIFDNVSVNRSGRSLFEPISFALKPGQVFTIQGPSGLGKSTLLQALIQPEDSVELSGQVTMDGRAMDPIERLAPIHKRYSRILYCLRTYRLVPTLRYL